MSFKHDDDMETLKVAASVSIVTVFICAIIWWFASR